MSPMTPVSRLRFTPQAFIYALYDLIAVVLIALGSLWLVFQEPLLEDFPASEMEALASISAGLLLSFWASAKLIFELQGPPGPTNPDP